MQLQSRKKVITFSSLLCFSVLAFPVASKAITVQEVPNPRQVNNTWVTDKANILSDSTEIQLNQMIGELDAKNGSEIAVVTVPDTKPSVTPKAFARELFNYWGIGKKGKNNGVLLLISSGERRVQIETGSGIQGILPDAKTVSIIQTEIAPKFKQQDFDGGTLAGTKALVNILQTPAISQSQTALPLAPIVPRQGVQPSATQPQNTPLVPPTVQSSGVIPPPIPAQPPVVVQDNSPVGWLIFLLILALPVLLIGAIIRAIISGFRSSSNSSSGDRNNRRRNYGSRSSDYNGTRNSDYISSSNDYSSSSNDYSSSSSNDYSSSSSSDSGGSFGGGDSGGGGGGGDY